MSFEFFLREAWTGIRRSGIMSVVSLLTITVSLVVFGTFLLAIFNMSNAVSSVGSKMEVVGYIDKDIDDYTANSISLEIQKIDGVESVKYTPKSQAWEEFRTNYEGRLDLAEVVKENPLPNTFVIKVRSPELISIVAKKMSNIQAIDEVRYSGNLADRLKTILDATRTGGMILVGLLLLATLLIVVNTIRLTVISRQTDIYIMKLVGATDSFVKWPFIIEGILIGVFGSALSFVVLKFSYDIIMYQIQSALPFVPLLASSSLEVTWIYLSVVLLGIFLGIIGAYISINSILKETN